MRYLFVLSALLLAFTTTANAQSAKSMYVELGGPGIASINFDTRFTGKEDGIGGRIGVGYFSVERESLTTIPIGVTYLLGKDQRNYFEVGGGATFVSYKGTSSDGTFEGSFGHLNFGYRLQPKNGGFLFRAAINPIFGSGGFVPYYAGIAFGYKF